MRIALFGGSFDPPHLGHVLAATYARVVGRADEVWILPVARHAFGKPISPWEQRWRLCQAAFGDLPFARLRDDERRNADGYTIDLVEKLGREHPEHRWLLVGGSDMVQEMPTWHRGAELRPLVEVIAIPRRGFDDHPAALPAISSSQVRERLVQGGEAGNLLPPKVAELIAANSWYR
jgi:nicotinate-nucleotide adenylyltransferase